VTSNLGAGSRSVLRTVKVNVALIDIASPLEPALNLHQQAELTASDADGLLVEAVNVADARLWQSRPLGDFVSKSGAESFLPIAAWCDLQGSSGCRFRTTRR
jgi:hypothetical protein